MRKKHVILTAIALATSLFYIPLDVAAAAEASPLGKFEKMVREGPRCQPEAKFRAASSMVMGLTPAQYRFAQGAYMMIPPVAFKLPEGSSAEFFMDTEGTVLIGFVDEGQVCNLMPVDDDLMKVFVAVDSGKVEHVGTGL